MRRVCSVGWFILGRFSKASVWNVGKLPFCRVKSILWVPSYCTMNQQGFDVCVLMYCSLILEGIGFTLAMVMPLAKSLGSAFFWTSSSNLTPHYIHIISICMLLFKVSLKKVQTCMQRYRKGVLLTVVWHRIATTGFMPCSKLDWFRSKFIDHYGQCV